MFRARARDGEGTPLLRRRSDAGEDARGARGCVRSEATGRFDSIRFGLARRPRARAVVRMGGRRRGSAAWDDDRLRGRWTRASWGGWGRAVRGTDEATDASTRA